MAQPTDEDAEWMRRVAADEPGAFDTLVARTLPRLLAFLRSMGADAFAAEDLAQEVYLKVYRHRASWQPRARFSTYLFHVARNQFIDAYRQERGAPRTTSLDAPAGSGPAGEPPLSARLSGRGGTPGQRDRDRALGAALAAVLAGLDGARREVFLLAHVHRMAYGDIAEVLGVPVGTVKSRVHAVTQEVREGLRRRGIEP